MPCDSIRTIGVELEKCNAQTMLAALTDLKLSPRLAPNGHTIWFGNNEVIHCDTGKAELNQWRDIAEIKRAYSKATVFQTAKKNGWQVVPVAGKQNQYQVIKR